MIIIETIVKLKSCNTNEVGPVAKLYREDLSPPHEKDGGLEIGIKVPYRSLEYILLDFCRNNEKLELDVYSRAFLFAHRPLARNYN